MTAGAVSEGLKIITVIFRKGYDIVEFQYTR